MDDGLIIAQNKSIDISNSYLFCSYNVLSKLLDSFGLIIEHAKTEVFHFNRSHRVFNPPQLDLSPIGGPTSQGNMEILRFHLRQKAHIPPTYRPLLEQSYTLSQVYEAIGKFVMRNQPCPKMPTV